MHTVIDPRDALLSRDLGALGAETERRLPSLTETERRLHVRLQHGRATRRRVMLAGGLAAACGTALAAPLLLESSPNGATKPEVRATAAASQPVAASDRDDAQAPVTTTRARRDALRREITRRAPTVAAATPSAPGAYAAARDGHPARDAEPSPTHLENRMGAGREKLTAFLNEELSPLLSECVEQARARAPGESGMYAIGIETLADADLGAVVDVADPTTRNEIADPLFFECVRESAFTLVFPPPLTTGQETFEITGYFGPRPAADAVPAKP